MDPTPAGASGCPYTSKKKLPCEVADVKYTLDGSVPKEDQVNMRALKEVIKNKVEQSEEVLETVAEEVKSKGLMARKNKETE